MEGLINDPYMDQTYKIDDGLRMPGIFFSTWPKWGSCGHGIPDLMTPRTPQTWLVGSDWRSHHGEPSASGTGFRPFLPRGIQEWTSGDVQVAIEAIQVAAHPHCFLACNKQGQSAIVSTKGNPDCHIILRGGRRMVNYTAARCPARARNLRNQGCRLGLWLTVAMQ